MSFFVYLLESEDKKATYVGATVDLERRLRQHNGEIKGGAHATSMKLPVGKWHRAVHVKNFPDWNSALQFEWRWKSLSRKKIYASIKPSIQRRLVALQELMGFEKATTKAIPYLEWSIPPEIVFENETAKQLYSTLHPSNSIPIFIK